MAHRSTRERRRASALLVVFSSALFGGALHPRLPLPTSTVPEHVCAEGHRHLGGSNGPFTTHDEASCGLCRLASAPRANDAAPPILAPLVAVTVETVAAPRRAIARRLALRIVPRAPPATPAGATSTGC